MKQKTGISKPMKREPTDLNSNATGNQSDGMELWISKTMTWELVNLKFIKQKQVNSKAMQQCNGTG